MMGKSDFSEQDDLLSIASFDSDDSESMADSGSFVAISFSDDPDDAIEKVLEAGVLAYTKRDRFHILSLAHEIEHLHGVNDSDVLSAHHAFTMAKLAYIGLYLDFERIIIKKDVSLSCLTEEAKGHIDHYKYNDKIGFENHLNDILTHKLYPSLKPVASASVVVSRGLPCFFTTGLPDAAALSVDNKKNMSSGT